MQVLRFRKAVVDVLLPVALLVAGLPAWAQFPGMEPPRRHAWSDAGLSADARARLVIEEMTLDEKIQLLHGMGWRAMFVTPESGARRAGAAAVGLHPRHRAAGPA